MIPKEKLTNLIDKTLQKTLDSVLLNKDIFWEEVPLPFKEFVESEDHMNFPPLSERQLMVADFMLGKDLSKVFDNGNYLAVLCYGKGCISGDTKLYDAESKKVYTVKELTNKQKSIHTWSVNKDGTVVIKPTGIPFKKGRTELFQVCFNDGSEITISKEHKLLTLDGWKPLVNLRVNDLVGAPQQLETGSKINFIKITNIKSVGVQDFYDLEVMDTHNYFAGGVFNHNSGKDSISALILLYVVYILLCMQSPQLYLNFPEGEPIDCLNVARSSTQAMQVFFEKLKQRVTHWKWLRSKYPIKKSGVYLTQFKSKKTKAVIITRNGIVFPKNVRIFSGHSADESMEGLNLLVYVLDEASGFDNADKLFNVLRSSSVSRFGSRGKGFILSYPRFKDDFTMRMYEQYKSELHVYTDKAFTWEVKPRHLFSKEEFDFEGIKIPIDFKDEFKFDPVDAKSKYLCQPPDIESPFIEYPDKINTCIDFHRKPICFFETYIENDKVKKRIIDWNIGSQQREYVITIDLGLKNDKCALSIHHLEKEPEIIIVQDLITCWEPDVEKSYIVSFTNVEDIITELKNKINIVSVFFDQWNSQLLIQRLSQLGVYCRDYRLNFQDYKNLKEWIYNSKIRLLNNEILVSELRKLVLLKGGKVDHPPDGSKDLVDTVVGAIKVLLGNTQKETVPLDGIRISSNLNMDGTFI